MSHLDMKVHRQSSDIWWIRMRTHWNIPYISILFLLFTIYSHIVPINSCCYVCVISSMLTCTRCSFTATWVKSWSQKTSALFILFSKAKQENFESLCVLNSIYCTPSKFTSLNCFPLYCSVLISVVLHTCCVSPSFWLQMTLCLNRHLHIFEAHFVPFLWDASEWQEERYVDEDCLCRYLRSYGVYRVFTAAVNLRDAEHLVSLIFLSLPLCRQGGDDWFLITDTYA